jgi:hypothetical protein
MAIAVLIAYVGTFVVWSRLAERHFRSTWSADGYLFVAGVLLPYEEPTSWRLEFIVQTVFRPLIKIDQMLGGPTLEATSVPMFELSRVTSGTPHSISSDEPVLRDEFFHDFAVDICQTEIAGRIAICELRVIESEQMQHRGMQVVHGHTIFDRFESEFIRRAMHIATADATTRHPDREAVMIVVAAVDLSRV